ncbi:hypothetical protein ASD04_14875 [Devosia sp. Root436]|nr:hypothetical protein ASD04_14875 [Devosia sp. Root436]
MTNEERAVMQKLVEAWNAFVALPVEHPDDANEFRFHIHALQNSLLSRPTRREWHDSEAQSQERRAI